jgi:hypothetical protein
VFDQVEALTGKKSPKIGPDRCSGLYLQNGQGQAADVRLLREMFSWSKSQLYGRLSALKFDLSPHQSVKRRARRRGQSANGRLRGRIGLVVSEQGSQTNSRSSQSSSRSVREQAVARS